MNRVLISFALVSVLLMACNQDAERRAKVVDQIRSSADLATVEYVLSKTVTAKNKNWFAKDAFFFAETEAVVKAGIDLSKLHEDDIKIEGQKISMTLPPVKIINLSYPAENFQVIGKYTDSPSLLAWQNISIEQKDDLYRQAESDIRLSIKELNIVETAQRNTRLLLSKILRINGFSEVYIHFNEPEKLAIAEGK